MNRRFLPGIFCPPDTGLRRLGELKPGNTVAVIGAGPTGLCTMLCARLYSPLKVIAIDTEESRLELAKRQGLADVVLVPGKDQIEERILEETSGRGADVVFEVAGGEDTFSLAWRIARPNAIVVIVAMYEKNQTLPLPQMYGKNLTFKTGGVDGCSCGEIMELIASRKLDAGFLITHRMAFQDVMEAYEIFEQKKDGVTELH